MTVKPSELSAAEKLRLIESLWDDLSREPGSVPVEDWQRAELDRREAVGPSAGVSSWDEVKARLSRRHGV